MTSPDAGTVRARPRLGAVLLALGVIAAALAGCTSSTGQSTSVTQSSMMQSAAPEVRDIDLGFAGLPADPVGFNAGDLEQAWKAGQPFLIAIRPNTPALIATGSDHYVHVRQPDLVEAMVDIVADRTSR